MRKDYQQARTEVAQREEPAGQIALPMAEILRSLEQGLGELIRKTGSPLWELS